MTFESSFSFMDLTMIERVSNIEDEKQQKTRRKLLVAGLLLLVVAVAAVHRPLPANFAERNVMHVVDVVLQLSYMQPVKIMTALGASHHTAILHVRRVLDMGARLLSPYGKDNDMKIYETTIAGVRVWVYEPREHVKRTNDGAVLFIHGGGFVLGEIEGYDTLMRTMVRQLKMVLITVDYRRAPEHTYPAAHDDVEAVTVALLQHAHLRFGVNPTNIVMVGDSAGGNLVAVTSQRLRRMKQIGASKMPELKGQVLWYPLVQMHDLTLSSYTDYFATMTGTAFLDPAILVKSYFLYMGIEADESHVDAMLDGGRWKKITQHKFGHRLSESDLVSYASEPTVDEETHAHAAHLDHLWDSPSDWSPLLADDMSNLPPAFVATVQHDILRSEGGLYARALSGAGVPVEYRNYETGFHAMLNFYQYLPVAQRMIQDTTDWIKQAVN